MGNDRFYAVMGMPVDKVQQYQNATSCQKRYAKCFDTNRNGIFDLNEVMLFNATTFSRKNDNTVIFYTQTQEKTWFQSTKEKIATKFKDNPSEITYDIRTKNLAGKKIMPYKVTNCSQFGNYNNEYMHKVGTTTESVNGYSVKYLKDGRIESVNGYAVKYSKDGRIEKMNGYTVKYSMDGRIEKMNGFPVKYSEDGRIEEMNGYTVKYSKDGRIEKMNGYTVKYSGNYENIAINNQTAKQNFLIIMGYAPN